MPNGSHLTLAGQRTASQLVLTVQDTGVGMTAEELPRLVYALIYHQAPRRTDLGLYVVREILKAHRGTVEATSTPRRGTIFTIRLPLVVAGEISTV